jgi:hypothetical protein
VSASTAAAVQEPWPEDFCDAYDLIGAFDRSGARFDPELFGRLAAEVDPVTWMRIAKIGEARSDEIAETVASMMKGLRSGSGVGWLAN